MGATKRFLVIVKASKSSEATWQIVPTVLPELLMDKDTGKSERVMQAMLQMKKLDIQRLKRASEGKADR